MAEPWLRAARQLLAINKDVHLVACTDSKDPSKTVSCNSNTPKDLAQQLDNNHTRIFIMDWTASKRCLRLTTTFLRPRLRMSYTASGAEFNVLHVKPRDEVYSNEISMFPIESNIGSYHYAKRTTPWAGYHTSMLGGETNFNSYNTSRLGKDELWRFPAFRSIHHEMSTTWPDILHSHEYGMAEIRLRPFVKNMWRSAWCSDAAVQELWSRHINTFCHLI